MLWVRVAVCVAVSVAGCVAVFCTVFSDAHTHIGMDVDENNDYWCNKQVLLVYVAVSCSVFDCLAVSFGVLQFIAVTDTHMLGVVCTKTIVINACGGVLQYVAVRCSVWQ